MSLSPHISQPAVAQAVSRGEKLADEKGWQLQEVLVRTYDLIRIPLCPLCLAYSVRCRPRFRCDADRHSGTTPGETIGVGFHQQPGETIEKVGPVAVIDEYLFVATLALLNVNVNGE